MTEPYQPYLLDTSGLSTEVGLERFESAAWQVDDLFDNIPFCIEGKIFEPCHGYGAITNPLRERGYTVLTNDIDPRLESDMHYDACDPSAPWPGRDGSDFGGVDWVITNPPFSLGVPILINMIDRVRMGVIMQLRITFSEPTIDRDRFFKKYKPNGIIVLQRNSFTGDGASDSATTAWFVWLSGNPPLYKGALGYQVFSKYKGEFFRIARNHKNGN